MPSLIATLGLNMSGFSRGLTEARHHAGKEGKAIAHELGEGISEKLREFAGAAALEESLRRTIEYAEKIGNAANRTGVAVEALQAWDQALKLNGSSIDEAIPMFEKLAMAKKKALEGDEKMITSFAKFGIGLSELKKMRIEDLGVQIASVFEKGDPQALIADFRELGGRGAGAMVAAFREGLAGAVMANRESNSIMSKETIESLKKTGDAFKGMWAEIRAGLGTVFAPILTGLRTALQTAVDVVTLFARGFGGLSVSEGGRWNNFKKAIHDFEKDIEDRNKAAEKAEDERKKRDRKPFDESEYDPRAEKEKKEKAVKEAAERMTVTANRHDLNALQQVGAYGGSAAATLDVSVKQEQHLGNIWRTIQKWDTQKPAPSTGVTF